jgi:hypothetical protein
MRSFITCTLDDRMIKCRRMRFVGCVGCMAEIRNTYKILVGKLEGKRPLGGHRRRWECNIRMDLRGGNVWTGFIWLRIGTSGWLF